MRAQTSTHTASTTPTALALRTHCLHSTPSTPSPSLPLPLPLFYALTAFTPVPLSPPRRPLFGFSGLQEAWRGLQCETPLRPPPPPPPSALRPHCPHSTPSPPSPSLPLPLTAFTPLPFSPPGRFWFGFPGLQEVFRGLTLRRHHPHPHTLPPHLTAFTLLPLSPPGRPWFVFPGPESVLKPLHPHFPLYSFLSYSSFSLPSCLTADYFQHLLASLDTQLSGSAALAAALKYGADDKRPRISRTAEHQRVIHQPPFRAKAFRYGSAQLAVATSGH